MCEIPLNRIGIIVLLFSGECPLSAMVTSMTFDLLNQHVSGVAFDQDNALQKVVTYVLLC